MVALFGCVKLISLLVDSVLKEPSGRPEIRGPSLGHAWRIEMLLAQFDLPLCAFSLV